MNPVKRMTWLAFIGVPSLVGAVVTGFLGQFVWLIVLLVIGIVSMIGSIFLRLVVVKEETAVAFKFGGRFAYMAMEFTGRYFESDGSIHEGFGDNFYGDGAWCLWRIRGWVFYIWPLVTPTRYEDQNEPGLMGEGVYVHLGDLSLEPETLRSETKGPESVALTVKFVASMRVVNAYKWLFVAPKDVEGQVEKRIVAVLRGWVNSGSQYHVQDSRGNGERMWKELVALDCMSPFNKSKDNWGLEVVPESIVVEEVDYDDDYQAALKAESQAKLLAKAKAAELAGPINQMMEDWLESQVVFDASAVVVEPALLAGKSEEECEKIIQKVKDDELKKVKDPKRAELQKGENSSWDRQLRLYKDLVLADRDNLKVERFEVSDAQGEALKGGLGPFAAAMGILKRTTQDNGNRGNRRDKGDSGGKKMTDSEKHAEADRIMKGG